MVVSRAATDHLTNEHMDDQVSRCLIGWTRGLGIVFVYVYLGLPSCRYLYLLFLVEGIRSPTWYKCCMC